MTRWLRRIRGAVGMGISWALGWALAGIITGLASFIVPGILETGFFTRFDAPLPALGVPGFVAGALFSVVLGVAARRRRFADLSLPQFTAWGALGGLLLSLVPAVLEVLNLATPAPGLNLWRLSLTIAPPFMVLGAASAAVTLSIARRAEARDIDAVEDEAPAGQLPAGGHEPAWQARQREHEPASRRRGD